MNGNKGEQGKIFEWKWGRRKGRKTRKVVDDRGRGGGEFKESLKRGEEGGKKIIGKDINSQYRLVHK